MCPIRIEMGDKSNNMQNCHFFFLLARKFAGLLQTEPFYSCKFAPDNPIYHIAEEQCNLANFSLHWSDYFGKLWQIYSRRSEHPILKCKGFVLIKLGFCPSSRAAVSYNFFWKGLSKISAGLVSLIVWYLIFFLVLFPCFVHFLFRHISPGDNLLGWTSQPHKNHMRPCSHFLRKINLLLEKGTWRTLDTKNKLQSCLKPEKTTWKQRRNNQLPFRKGDSL